MLSTVLRSPRAVKVNVEIMRAFVKLRKMLESNKQLKQQLDQLEQKYDEQFQVIFEAIRQLMAPPDTTQNTLLDLYPGLNLFCTGVM